MLRQSSSVASTQPTHFVSSTDSTCVVPTFLMYSVVYGRSNRTGPEERKSSVRPPGAMLSLFALAGIEEREIECLPLQS